MGKTSKWIRNFLIGKKEKEKEKEKEKSIYYQQPSIGAENTTTPITILPTTPKERRRWSFRRSSATAPGQKDINSTDTTIATTRPSQSFFEADNDQKRHALAVAAATAAAADAAVAAAQAAAAVIHLTATTTGRANAVEEAAAIKIQSVFRAHLARKALNALKGLVKLQALVRGHLVRKQATATLRCMQALITAQARARAQRIWMAEELKPNNQKQFNPRKSTHDNRFKNTHDFDRGMEENIKIVEMDLGESKGSTKSRNSYSSHAQTERAEHRLSTYSAPTRAYSNQDPQQISPAPSALTDLSPRTCSGYFDEYSSFETAKSSPQYYSAISSTPDFSKAPSAYPRADYAEPLYSEYPFYPSYMANTESSRAKARSQSAPKSRPDAFERQPSRRRPSIEGRNVPRAVKMQRSSSHVGSNAQNYQYPWSIKLNRSNVSLKDSECGSTSTVLTNTIYCRSLVGFEVQGNRNN